MTIGCIHARIVLVVAFAGQEFARLRVVGRVVCAPDAVKRVLAEVGSICTGRVAYFEAKFSTSHETWLKEQP